MFRITLATLLMSASATLADAPRVVTDILPVQGLVAGVMDGIGEPAVLLPPGADPHGHALRPSDAASLETAGLVIWIGEDLTPWLAKPLATLAGDTEKLELLRVEGTRLIEIEKDGGHDDHGHDDHGHDGHAHSGIDPHAWLDPDNALMWLDAISDALAAADPGNADAYKRNAAEIADLIRAETADIEARLAGLAPVTYAVHHDAYGYFESRFGLAHAFSVIPADGREPGPRRIAELRETARAGGVERLIADEGLDVERLAATLFEPRSPRICSFDPLGTGLEPGLASYPQFLRRLADDMQACLAP